ncbi:CASP-like protein 4A1, partial [Camarhynchus parvulus]|uniref:CASP-like protein 4A1 n=1 Tax=Geospiza parvula TaxID=87175 RepID=UPI001237EB19
RHFRPFEPPWRERVAGGARRGRPRRGLGAAPCARRSRNRGGAGTPGTAAPTLSDPDGAPGCRARRRTAPPPPVPPPPPVLPPPAPPPHPPPSPPPSPVSVAPTAA